MINFTMLVHDRPRLTQQALGSLKVAGMENLSVTILDDASQQETQEFLQYWSDENDAHLIRLSESAGTGLARNRVIKESEECFGRGEFLYLSDNDVLFYPSWSKILETCYRVARRDGYAALGAYNHPFHQPEDTLAIYGKYSVKKVGALALQSMMMRWQDWDDYGPFCSTPVGRVCMGEDVEFAWRLAAAGMMLGVVCPALVVNTGITNSFGDKIPGWEIVQAQAPPGVLVE